MTMLCSNHTTVFTVHHSHVLCHWHVLHHSHVLTSSTTTTSPATCMSSTTATSSACPTCYQTPCVIKQPPSWLRGSVAPSLGNAAKRYRLYKRFWTLLGRLGVWNNHSYLATKALYTNNNDTREACVVKVLCNIG